MEWAVGAHNVNSTISGSMGRQCFLGASNGASNWGVQWGFNYYWGVKLDYQIQPIIPNHPWLQVFHFCLVSFYREWVRLGIRVRTLTSNGFAACLLPLISSCVQTARHSITSILRQFSISKPRVRGDGWEIKVFYDENKSIVFFTQQHASLFLHATKLWLQHTARTLAFS